MGLIKRTVKNAAIGPVLNSLGLRGALQHVISIPLFKAMQINAHREGPKGDLKGDGRRWDVDPSTAKMFLQILGFYEDEEDQIVITVI